MSGKSRAAGERLRQLARRHDKAPAVGRGPSRDGGIRTRDPLNPIQVRYQTALRPASSKPREASSQTPSGSKYKPQETLRADGSSYAQLSTSPLQDHIRAVVGSQTPSGYKPTDFRLHRCRSTHAEPAPSRRPERSEGAARGPVTVKNLGSKFPDAKWSQVQAARDATCQCLEFPNPTPRPVASQHPGCCRFPDAKWSPACRGERNLPAHSQRLNVPGQGSAPLPCSRHGHRVVSGGTLPRPQ